MHENVLILSFYTYSCTMKSSTKCLSVIFHIFMVKVPSGPGIYISLHVTLVGLKHIYIHTNTWGEGGGG